MLGFRHQPIGEMLYHAGIINHTNLTDALDQQQREGGLLGNILVGKGIVHYHTLYQLLAKQQKRIFVDMITTPCDPTLLDVTLRQDYHYYQCLPWKKKGSVILLATPNITPELCQFANKHYPKHRFVITSPRDIQRNIQLHFSTLDDDDARLHLWKKNPEFSAKNIRFHHHGASLMLSLLALWILWLPFSWLLLSVIIVLNGFYSMTLLSKWLFFRHGWHTSQQNSTTQSSTAHNLIDRNLPIYSLLIPLFHENTTTIQQLLTALRALDYPKSKLDIKLIVENDDHATLAVIQAAKPEDYMHIIQVPYSLPRTKPKACNYALRFAQGEYVGIYDAEDIPDPNQLKSVLSILQFSDKNIAGVQCRLNYYNANYNILTRLFALEYASWFNFLLCGLNKFNIPIPLGGTSNHFRIDVLRHIGAWDAYNVTEDADLGIRLAQHGYKIALCQSLTLEEAPIHLSSWLRQRSRWIKGYIQTVLVHLRHPYTTYQKLGAVGMAGFLFFIGAPALVFITMPIMLFITGSSIFYTLSLPIWLIYWAFINMITGFLLHFIIAWIVLYYHSHNEQQHLPIKQAIWNIWDVIHSFSHGIGSYTA